MTQPAVVAFDHAALFVTEVAQACAFYSRLGFVEVAWLPLRSCEHVFMALEGSSTRLQISGPVATADVGAGHLALRVAEIDELYRHLVEAGARGVTEPYDIPAAHTRAALIADGDGHLIELVEGIPSASADSPPTGCDNADH